MLLVLIVLVSQTELINSAPGLIITGGYTNQSGISAELFIPSTGEQCKLPDMPQHRLVHKMVGEMVCGGLYSEWDCITLIDGEWQVTTELLESRWIPAIWDSPAGVVMIGGWESPNSTEIIQKDGTSTPGFPLEYSAYATCAINLGQTMLLTGGSHGAFRRVAEYSVSGYIRDLPSFQDKRWFHGCTYYYNEDGVRTFLVTGGIFKEKDEDPNIPISSTELLVETDQAWRYAGSLPSPRTALIGKNIDSRIFMTGGFNDAGDAGEEIVEWDPVSLQWKVVTKMLVSRYHHAVSIILDAETLCEKKANFLWQKYFS